MEIRSSTLQHMQQGKSFKPKPVILQAPFNSTFNSKLVSVDRYYSYKNAINDTK